MINKSAVEFAVILDQMRVVARALGYDPDRACVVLLTRVARSTFTTAQVADDLLDCMRRGDPLPSF